MLNQMHILLKYTLSPGIKNRLKVHDMTIIFFIGLVPLHITKKHFGLNVSIIHVIFL